MCLRAALTFAAIVVIGACSGGEGGSEPSSSDARVTNDGIASPGADHSAHVAGDSATSAATDHGAHAGGASPGAVASSNPTIPGMDHAAMDHAAMPVARTGSARGTAAPSSAGDHAGHAPTPAPSAAAAARAPARPGGAVAPSADETLGADSATAKLLTLARELVRDSVVQRRIEEDPALREHWERPEVREVLTGDAPR